MLEEALEVCINKQTIWIGKTLGGRDQKDYSFWSYSLKCQRQVLGIN
jgi:hypothetical protein